MKQKKLDKRKILVVVVAIIAAFLVIAALLFKWQYPQSTDFGTSGKFQEEEVKAVATEVTALFSEQEYEKIMTDYAGEVLLKDADAEDLKYAATTANADWGTFKEITSITLGELERAGNLYAVAEVQAVYENATITLTFSFDENLKLSGVYIQ